MKKIILIFFVFILGGFARAQHLETTIKVVDGKVRIAVKAVGGDIKGSPSGATFCIAIPAANASATLNFPTILDASRLPKEESLTTGNYQDAAHKYFILLWAGGIPPVTFVENTEYDLVELTWGGPEQTFPVSLISLADGNKFAPVLPFQWANYLETGGAQNSFGDQLFYQSATSTVPVQMTKDYSSGAALISTRSSITTSLPAELLTLNGYKNGGKNELNWTVSSEINNRGFDVQRSTDGNYYLSVGFVNTQAPGGFSNSQLSYTFDDNSPLGKKQYYRLNQQSLDGRGKLSNIVVIESSTTLGIGGLFPNPARTLVNVIIDAPQRDNITLLLTDMAGKTVKQQLVNVETGSNTVPIEISKLAQGSYLVKIICKSGCETATAKFNKL